MTVLRKKVVTLGILCLLVPVAILAVFSHFSEPRHNGRRLSEWLEDYTRHSSRHLKAEEAIQAIGTNAVPTLLKMLFPVDRTFSIARLFRRSGIPIELIENDTTTLPTYELAMHGFRILGTTASNAIPILLPHLENPETSYFASNALQGIGQPALAPVQDYLSSTNAYTKREAVHVILGITRRDPDSVAKLLRSPDPIIRGETYLWLHSHYLSPEYLLSTLLNGLNDPDTYVAQRAVLAIRSLNLQDATNALPRLYEKQSTTNIPLAQEISRVIDNIEKRIRIEAFAQSRQVD